jgi:phage terminase large subunit GpA-like protein
LKNAGIPELRDPRIVSLKGTAGWSKSPITGPSLIDVTERGKKVVRGLRLWIVAVDVYKSAIYRQLHLTRGDADAFPTGWVHLPESTDAEIIKQLTAEQLVTRKTKQGFTKLEWVKMRPNEMLDCLVYARAALSVLGSERYGAAFWARIGRASASKPQTQPAPALAGAAPTPAPGAVPHQRPRRRPSPRSSRSSRISPVASKSSPLKSRRRSIGLGSTD